MDTNSWRHPALRSVSTSTGRRRLALEWCRTHPVVGKAFWLGSPRSESPGGLARARAQVAGIPPRAPSFLRRPKSTPVPCKVLTTRLTVTEEADKRGWVHLRNTAWPRVAVLLHLRAAH